MHPVSIGLQEFFAVLALILFLLTGFNVTGAPRLNFLGLGLAALTLAFFLNIAIH
jgi:hypothetical protein